MYLVSLGRYHYIKYTFVKECLKKYSILSTTKYSTIEFNRPIHL